MHGRKRYWTEAFVVTILISTIFGFVAGSKYCAHPGVSEQGNCGTLALESNMEQRGITAMYQPLSSCFYTEVVCGPTKNPLIQPGAWCLSSCDTPQAGVAVQGKYLRIEGVPGCARTGFPRVHRTAHGILDATPIAIGLPLFIAGLLFTFRRSFFKVS